VPHDFDHLLNSYVNQGFRVLACAYSELAHNYGESDRAHLEKSLTFLGFIVFENKLKSSTVSVLDEIASAGLKMCMVTGDNIYTSISVGRASHMLTMSEPVFFPKTYGSDYMTLTAHDPVSGVELRSTISEVQNSDLSIACSGETFDSISRTLNQKLLKIFLNRCLIYGRMSPTQKKILVQQYQSFGDCICFCGDGANDCAALMAADVGVSLSQAEASVAAPFTSNICDITSLLVLLKNGRSSIVSSFVSFKFMSLYSLVQFTSLSFLYTFGSTFSDWQFIYIDLFIILPLGILMNGHEPAKSLALEKPDIKLISPPVLISILMQMLLQSLFQGVVFFRTRMVNPATSFANGPNVQNAEATSLAMFSAYVYLTQAVVFSEGKPHRQSYYGIYISGHFLANLIRASGFDYIPVILCKYTAVIRMCKLDRRAFPVRALINNTSHFHIHACPYLCCMCACFG